MPYEGVAKILVSSVHYHVNMFGECMSSTLEILARVCVGFYYSDLFPVCLQGLPTGIALSTTQTSLLNPPHRIGPKVLMAERVVDAIPS